jgi:hypothetical protein
MARCQVMVVSVDTSSGFRAGAPQKLFEGPYTMTPVFGQSYDVTPDGKRFVMVKYVPQQPPREIHIALNWFEELNAKVPSGTR